MRLSLLAPGADGVASPEQQLFSVVDFMTSSQMATGRCGLLQPQHHFLWQLTFRLGTHDSRLCVPLTGHNRARRLAICLRCLRCLAMGFVLFGILLSLDGGCGAHCTA